MVAFSPGSLAMFAGIKIVDSRTADPCTGQILFKLTNDENALTSKIMLCPAGAHGTW